MQTQQIIKNLWDKGIRHVEVTWRAGGDDGSVEEFNVFPPDRKIDRNTKHALESLAWNVYTEDFNGGCAGEFQCDGFLKVFIYEDGKYKASAQNTYTEDSYNEKTGDYDEGEGETTKIKNVSLSGDSYDD